MEPYEVSFSNALISLFSHLLNLFNIVKSLVEDAEVKFEREEESEMPNVLTDPPKKKRRTKEIDIPSMERIDSYMSNNYLRCMARGRSDPESTCKQNLLREKQAKKEEKEEMHEDRCEEW